ncbi:biotin-dependent carboxyltransferase family protein [Bacillus sp. 03113]|uniref:5-oxoprolinase subunit C family protein n=1 Tax=Bacillus sp. 03113 TaxID=2578211 RepID=UPI001144ABD7|nr:biotin-dependent carboxyltransferase family protein [Bacillus sp. 03113]
MSIRVMRPGLLTSIQDLGRYGFQQHGVIVSGAMDALSLRVANLLVGNEEKEAVLEMTLVGPSISFEEDSLIAITGGDLSPNINGNPVSGWRPIFVKKGSILKFGPCKEGCRTYLALAGGYDIPKKMNSKSTYLLGGIGGFNGRALKAGDVLASGSMSEKSNRLFNQLKLKQKESPFATTGWFVNRKEFLPLRKSPVIRVMNGRQFDLFKRSSCSEFFTLPFKVSSQSDRMGYRIAGPKIELNEKVEMISEAVTHGTIQIPPDGNPIILLADRQTTGGYPKIGQVVSVDLPLIAQTKPGEEIYFSNITHEEAEQLYLERERKLKALEAVISLN